MGVKYSSLPLMEDFKLTLDLLTKGYKNRISYYFSCGQTASNSDGGCSSYRDYELHKECAVKLKEAYPEFVTLVNKDNVKSGWKGLESRVDVRISWLKAYNSFKW